MATFQDVPCLSCQRGYTTKHKCDEPDYCACDRTAAHAPGAGDQAACAHIRREEGRMFGLTWFWTCLDCRFDPRVIPPGGELDPDEKDTSLIEDVVRFRREYVDAYIGQRATRCAGDFSNDDYDRWESEAHVRWREKYPAFTVLLPSHTPAPSPVVNTSFRPDGGGAA